MERQIKVQVAKLANELNGSCCEIQGLPYVIKQHIQQVHLDIILERIKLDQQKLQFQRKRLEKGKSDSISVECNCTDGLVLLFYNYTEIKNELSLAEELKSFSESREIQGKIRIGSEGFNITVGGSTLAIQEFMSYFMARTELLPGIDQLPTEKQDEFKTKYFKPTKGCRHCFDCLSVKIVNEICPFGDTLTKPSPYSVEVVHELLGLESTVTGVSSLTPRDFDFELENAKQDPNIIILDTRNYYESLFGYFDSAIRPPIRKFSGLKEYITDHKQEWQGKKIVTYCTGGVRCERASRYIQQETGGQVVMLRGGIHNYLKEFGTGNFKGLNYIFDARKLEGTGGSVAKCWNCGKGCSDYSKCKKCHLVLPICCPVDYCCQECQDGDSCSCSDVLKSLVQE
jgi:predicted sulfurtransferase